MLMCISGSLRRGSTNSALLREAARLYGGDHRFADLRLPLYDGDLEGASGLPEDVLRVTRQIEAAEAVVVSTPEYNKMLSGVLKNALDWISRTKPFVLQDKPVAILAAAAGQSGGARARYSLMMALAAFRPRFSTGPEVLIAGSGAAFDAEGRLSDPRSVAVLGQAMDRLRSEATA